MQVSRSAIGKTRRAAGRVGVGVACALASGVALRWMFIQFFPDFDGDSGVYGTIARNLLLHRAYALDAPYHLTLIRLPGYPFFLAVIFKLFGIDNFDPSRPIQLVVDMASCLLIAGFVRETVSPRAGRIALWMAALCPFTADYVAIPMTETDSIFCVSLAMYASARLIRGLRGGVGRQWAWVLLTSAALSGAILLRADGVVLSAAVLPGMWWYGRGRSNRAAMRTALTCALIAAAPLVAWTVRNYEQFHVFQPLAPRFANDPGETVPLGFIEWAKTWQADYISSPEIYWEGDDLAMNADMLPDRAFDSPEQRRATYQLIADYNKTCKSGGTGCSIEPDLDERFRELAEARYKSHPIRSYVVLPLARVADMWLRPRIEYLPIPMRWWEWRSHPASSAFALSYALLNAVLLLCAAIGFARRQVPLAGMLLAYIGLRCLLLAITLENAEPRYTLECFPMVVAAAAVALAGARGRSPAPNIAEIMTSA